ncbi:hypothetical protein PIIN_11698 [Serendipita indica DSM 11827]|uniref:RRM domain-containing protein n=1 Tax=Serendipita indica (strain DSM 11827) TaxID=1109443 RepID=G4TR48_SERID|nr:hypothetical protein PIIN_11698 [Serendipita indica DSM 11827]
MSKRLYVGNARPEDVKSFFGSGGAIVDCRILTGTYFATTHDAEDVVRNFNGKNFMGSEIIVEQAKDSRPKRGGYEDRGGGGYRGDGGHRGDRGGPGGGGGRPPRVPGIRLVVTGVSRDTSWQDLKDFARQAGNVTFADIDRDVPNQGVIEYSTREEADQAIRDLDGKEIRGTSVRVALDDRRGAVGGGYSRGSDRYGGSDRYNGGGGGGYRRDRSRSPRRYDDRRRYDEDRGERRREDRYEERDRGEERRREDRGDRERRER